MQEKQKPLKILCVVNTDGIIANEETHAGGMSNILLHSKRQFKLYVGEPSQLSKKSESYVLTLVDQQKSKAGHYHTNFILKKQINVKKQDILVKVPFVCNVSENKLLLPEEEIRRIMNEFRKLNQRDDSEESEQSQMSERSDQGRGRGRPKGSKNKKNQDESSDESYSDLVKLDRKQGKGRPKGSKNKKKDIFQDQITYETNFHTIFKKLLQFRTFQEINRRFNRNAVKEKEEAEQGNNFGDLNGKKSRGRPKGVKNKQKRVEYDQESEPLNLDPLPQRQPLKSVQKCCSKCSVRQNKRLFLQGKLKDKSVLKNIADNIGVQDTTNIILKTIKSNKQAALKQLLLYVNNFQNQFLVPWDCNHRLEFVGYTVRTRKQYLIKYKKEMINALLQDRYTHRGPWWQIVGIQRLMENMPLSEHGIQIYQILTKSFPQLVQIFYQNIPSLVRCGNQTLAYYLFQKVLSLQENNTLYGYSRDHLECLNKKKSQIQFKKSTMLKQNCTANFCSPIHCAVINSNTDLLSYILKHISQFNVGDSQGRKPIHYAVALQSPKALQILHKHNSEQLTQMDKKKMTPLILAAHYGKANNLSFILQKMRDKDYINHKCDAGLTALHYAILNQHIECIQILLEDPLVNISEQTKQRFSILHLAAGVGNKQIVKMVLAKDNRITWDNFRRSPFVIALRNHHNDIFFQLLKETKGQLKRDYSNNTLLHYAAAYGNLELVIYLSKVMNQIPNKKNFLPWEVAVLKGHFLCAQHLQIKNEDFPRHHHLVFLLLKNPRGTKQFFAVFKYILKMQIYKLDYQYNNVGDTCLHLICSISQRQYETQRERETSQMSANQYDTLQENVIKSLLQNGADPEIVNQKSQKPVNLCIENQNSIGIQLLLVQIPFQVQPVTRNNHFVYYLTNLACKGKKQIKFVHQKLIQVDEKVLKVELKKTDCLGFEFLIFLIKNFTQTVHSNFRQNYKKNLQTYSVDQRHLPQTQKNCIMYAYQQYTQHQSNLLKLVNFLVDKGADPRAIVTEPKVQRQNQNYKKWGIQHFLMRFPSLILLKTFMKWIDKNFNMQNSQGRTPLHLFCMWNREGCLFNTQETDMTPLPHINFTISKDYDGQASLEYLLENGLTSNILDINKSTPLLYTALNGQLKFMNLLRHYGSSINNCNLLNQVPIIQIIKAKNKFTVEQIGSILQDNGPSADCVDIDNRNALHHLVSNATNFDTSPEIFKKLLQYGVKINSIDKYGRSPIFYCFIKIRENKNQDQTDNQNQRNNDKVQILQALLNCQSIDLNIVDIYNKNPLHYACQKKFFFSILYLLDKNINYDIKDLQGNTPLAICLKHRMLNQAALLIKKGVKSGQVYEQGHVYCYFEYAVTKLSVGICFMLLDHGYPLQKALEEVKNQAFKRVLRKKYVQAA